MRWRSYELRPAGSVVSPEYRAKIENYRPQMRAMAKERYGLEINEGPFGINSRPALIGAKFAEEQGVGEVYHDAVFRAYWQEAGDISDLNVLGDIAEEVGLERPLFCAALEDEKYDQQVSADIEQAFMYGLNGVPAAVFAEKYLVSGAQPYEAFVQVAQKVLADG